MPSNGVVSLCFLVMSSVYLVKAAVLSPSTLYSTTSPIQVGSRYGLKLSSLRTYSGNNSPSSAPSSPISSYFRTPIRLDSSGSTGLGYAFDEFLKNVTEAEESSFATLEPGSEEYKTVKAHFVKIFNAIAHCQQELLPNSGKFSLFKDLVSERVSARNALEEELQSVKLSNERLKEENEFLRKETSKAYESILFMIQETAKARLDAMKSKNNIAINSFIECKDQLPDYFEHFQQKITELQMETSEKSRILKRTLVDYATLQAEDREKSNRLVQLESALASTSAEIDHLKEREKADLERHIGQIMAQRETIENLEAHLRIMKRKTYVFEDEQRIGINRAKSSTQHNRSNRRGMADSHDLSCTKKE